jgi:hypothetical protein
VEVAPSKVSSVSPAEATLVIRLSTRPIPTHILLSRSVLLLRHLRPELLTRYLDLRSDYRRWPSSGAIDARRASIGDRRNEDCYAKACRSEREWTQTNSNVHRSPLDYPLVEKTQSRLLLKNRMIHDFVKVKAFFGTASGAPAAFPDEMSPG